MPNVPTEHQELAVGTFPAAGRAGDVSGPCTELGRLICLHNGYLRAGKGFLLCLQLNSREAGGGGRERSGDKNKRVSAWCICSSC